MAPVLIEVHCRLRAEDPQWEAIRSVILEVGYPGQGGRTFWKQTAWLRNPSKMAGSSSAHAMWNRATTEQVLVFDFYPFLPPGSSEPEKSFRVRRHIEWVDGRKQRSSSVLVRNGRYSDDYFICIMQ